MQSKFLPFFHSLHNLSIYDMSIERNPNINAVGLTLDVLDAIQKHLRGNFDSLDVFDCGNLVQDFVIDISDRLDLLAALKKDSDIARSRPKLIQNAVFHKKDGRFYISTNVHDWVEFKLDGETAFIDGGTEYRRSSFLEHPDIEEYSLYEDSSDEEVYNKLLWGTYGKYGNQPLTWVLLKDCSREHLEAILATQKHLGPDAEKVIKKALNG